MLYFKPDVEVGSPTKELLAAIYTVAVIYAGHDYDCWITSMVDGTHLGKPVDDSGKDPHYVGKAADFRVKNLPVDLRDLIVRQIKERLGDTYVVIREAIGTPYEHIHIQVGHVIA